MEKANINTAAITLVGLSVEYCRIVDSVAATEPQVFLREVLRYLPRFYVTFSDLADAGEEPAENDSIYQILDEDGYNAAREAMAAVFGEYDVYLDTPVEDMRYSDTPVGVSLSEQLADIYQAVGDFAGTVRQIPSEMIPEAVEEILYRFNQYLSDTICSALRASNSIYQIKALVQE